MDACVVYEWTHMPFSRSPSFTLKYSSSVFQVTQFLKQCISEIHRWSNGWLSRAPDGLRINNCSSSFSWCIMPINEAREESQPF